MKRWLFLFIIGVVLLTASASFAQEATELIVIAERDTLLIYILDGDTAPLRDFVFRVIAGDRHVNIFLADYNAFGASALAGLGSPGCLIFQRAGSPDPLSSACGRLLETSILTQSIAPEDVFWWDSATDRRRALIVQQADARLSACPADNAECSIVYPASPIVQRVARVGEALETTTDAAASIAPDNTSADTSDAERTGYIFTNGSAARVRGAATASAQLVTTVDYGQAITVVEEVTGDSISGSTLWYRIRLANGTSGFVHSSVISNTVPPSLDAVAAPTAAPAAGGATTAPAAGTGVCAGGRMQGSASGLFALAGRRRTNVTLPAGATITINASVSNGSGDWGVGFVLVGINNEDLISRQIVDENTAYFNQIVYTSPTTGSYGVEVRGDASHTYDYTVTWTCN